MIEAGIARIKDSDKSQHVIHAAVRERSTRLPALFCKPALARPACVEAKLNTGLEELQYSALTGRPAYGVTFFRTCVF